MLWSRPASEHAFYAQWKPFRAALRPGDVIMMPSVHAAMDIAAVTGARTVAVPFAAAVPDLLSRTASIEWFFSEGVSRETRLIELNRWQANKIVLVGPSLKLAPAMEALFGNPLWRDATAIVYDAGR
jgi:hypothetical protein